MPDESPAIAWNDSPAASLPPPTGASLPSGRRAEEAFPPAGACARGDSYTLRVTPKKIKRAFASQAKPGIRTRVRGLRFATARCMVVPMARLFGKRRAYARHFGYPVGWLVADRYEKAVNSVPGFEDEPEVRLHRKVLGSAIERAIRELSFTDRVLLFFGR